MKPHREAQRARRLIEHGAIVGKDWDGGYVPLEQAPLDLDVHSKAYQLGVQAARTRERIAYQVLTGDTIL